jgi:sporulation protein YlmC with PRC-barrel domain
MKKLHFLVLCAVGATALTASAESKPQRASTDRIRVIAAGELFDKDVMSSDGQEIGDVEYVLIRTDDGKIDHVVIETEAKDELVAIPFDAVRGSIHGDEIQIQTTMDKINKAPRVKESELSTLSQPAVIQEVEMYWVPLGSTGQTEKQTTPGQQPQERPRTTPEKGLETEAIDETPDEESTDPVRRTGVPTPGEEPGGQPMQGQQGTPSGQPMPRAQGGTTTQQGQTAEGAGEQTYLLLARSEYHVLKPSVTTAEAIEGMEVMTSDGHPIGEVEEVVIDLDNGYVAYTLVSRGGFIGLGRNYVAVPFQAMELTDTGLSLKTPARTFKNMRGYVDDDVPRSVRISDLERVYKQFKITPYFKQKEEVATR